MTFPAGRTCRTCRTAKLSIYHPGPDCWSCVRRRFAEVAGE